MALTKIRRESSEKSVRVQVNSDHFFIFESPGNTIYANCDYDELVASLTQYPSKETLRHWQLTLRECELAVEEIGQEGKSDFETLQWKIAKFYTEDSPPKGINLHTAKVHLTHWPNFIGLSHSDDELRIAALWTVRPTSMVSTATTLQLDMEIISAFFKKASATGLVSINHSKPNGTHENNNLTAANNQNF